MRKEEREPNPKPFTPAAPSPPFTIPTARRAVSPSHRSKHRRANNLFAQALRPFLALNRRNKPSDSECFKAPRVLGLIFRHFRRVSDDVSGNSTARPPCSVQLRLFVFIEPQSPAHVQYIGFRFLGFLPAPI